MKRTIFLFISALLAYGCAEFQTPNPKQILTHPIGSTALRIGMSQDEVIAKWGKPDSIKQSEKSDTLGLYKEEWIYNARCGRSPVDADYFSKTKHLFFDGKNLTSWTEESEK